MNNVYFKEATVSTPIGNQYHGLLATGDCSAVIILRAGAALEYGITTSALVCFTLTRVEPD